MNQLEERTRSNTEDQMGPVPRIGRCVATEHPSLPGRVRVQVGEETPRWMPTMRGLRVRAHDRVLVTQPQNWPEPVVVGVVDGLLPTDARSTPVAELQLAPNESLRIVNARREAILELSTDDDGRPQLALVHPDLELSTPGELRLSASTVSIHASRGDVCVDANHDVVVTGEVVHLN